MAIVKGACPHDCPDTCAWDVTVENGRATGLKGDPAHPFTEGALCSKLKRYLDRVYSTERVLYPMRRTGAKGSGEFERVSWDTAIAEITGKLNKTIAEHGPLSAMPYNFAGTISLLQRYASDQFFARLGATPVAYDICGEVAMDGVASTIGLLDPVLPQDMIHSRYIIIWGTNTVATNVHLWSAVLRKAKRAGARIVVVDPVRTETARSADLHLQIEPGTDAALALGMMHVIVKEGLHDADFIAQHSIGFAELVERLEAYPPARVAEITRIPAAVIESVARDFATTKPAIIRLLVGMERHANGGMTFRTVSCLPTLTGAWRERGGGLCQFTVMTFFDAINYAAIRAPEPTAEPARKVHLAQLGKALTDADMDPPLTWLMVYNSNPVVTAPHQNLVRQGLEREDLFTVVHEQFMTDTALYADYLLPATTQVEHLELMPSWGHTYLALNKPAIEPRGEAIPNTELFRRLSRAMGFTDECLHVSDEARVRQLLDSGSPYIEGITYERLEHTGWAALNLPDDWRPLASGKFQTPSGKCEFYSQTLAAAGHDPLPAYVPPNDMPAYPLKLISAKAAHFLNSEYVNLRHKGTINHQPECAIHPADAARRELHQGDLVAVYNDLGEVRLRAGICEDTPEGVVSVPFNWWPATTHNNASANALTPDGLSDRAIGSDAFGARVEVKAAAG